MVPGEGDDEPGLTEARLCKALGRLISWRRTSGWTARSRRSGHRWWRGLKKNRKSKKKTFHFHKVHSNTHQSNDETSLRHNITAIVVSKNCLKSYLIQQFLNLTNDWSCPSRPNRPYGKLSRRRKFGCFRCTRCSKRWRPRSRLDLVNRTAPSRSTLTHIVTRWCFTLGRKQKKKRTESFSKFKNRSLKC